MTINRLVILLVLLGCGLGTIFLIPRETKLQPCRVRMELPEFLGGMVGKPAQVSQAEHDLLAEDTEFCRKVYDDGFGTQVLVSIVLSGHDLDNSIHRPERCLRAQGWIPVGSSTTLSLPVAQAPGGALPVTRLYNVQQMKTKSGQIVPVYELNYYWFIGYSDITASHFRREYIDMKDRLLHGYNQRWAYVTVACEVTKGLNTDGKDESETDAMIQKVIAEVFPKIVTKTGSNETAMQ